MFSQSHCYYSLGLPIKPDQIPLRDNRILRHTARQVCHESFRQLVCWDVVCRVAYSGGVGFATATWDETFERVAGL